MRSCIFLPSSPLTPVGVTGTYCRVYVVRYSWNYHDQRLRTLNAQTTCNDAWSLVECPFLRTPSASEVNRIRDTSSKPGEASCSDKYARPDYIIRSRNRNCIRSNQIKYTWNTTIIARAFLDTEIILTPQLEHSRVIVLMENFLHSLELIPHLVSFRSPKGSFLSNPIPNFPTQNRWFQLHQIIYELFQNKGIRQMKQINQRLWTHQNYIGVYGNTT